MASTFDRYLQADMRKKKSLKIDCSAFGRFWIFLLKIHRNLNDLFWFSAAATGPAYPAQQQTGYAVTPAATAATYNAQRTGYDQAAYQAAATQGTYASEYFIEICENEKLTILFLSTMNQFMFIKLFANI